MYGTVFEWELIHGDIEFGLQAMQCLKAGQRYPALMIIIAFFVNT